MTAVIARRAAVIAVIVEDIVALRGPLVLTIIVCCFRIIHFAPALEFDAILQAYAICTIAVRIADSSNQPTAGLV
jgi:hypothetical protein